MKWVNFKNRIKNDLYNYKSEENALDIWDSINADVDTLNNKNKKKDNRLLFFLVFLIGISGLTYFVMEDKQDLSSEKGKSELSIAANEIEEETQKSIEQVTSSNLNSKAIGLPKKETSNTILESKANKIKTASKSKIEIVKTEILTPNRSLLKSIPNSEIILDEKFVADRSSSSIPKEAVKKETLVVATSTLSAIDLLKLKMFEIDNQQTWPKVSNFEFKKIEKVKMPIPAFSLGLNAGVSYVNKILEADEPEGLTFLKQRLATEKNLEALHGSLYGSYGLNSNLSFSLGLNFTRVNEAFNFVEVAEEVALVQGVKYIFTGPGINATRLQTIGEVRETTTSVTDYTLFNKYDLIDIPFLVSYQLNKNKWSYGAQAGIIANLSFKGNGRILESGERTALISEQDVFKNTLGLSYALNFLIEHRMNDSFSLVFTPSFRYFPNEITFENYSLNQKYQFAGMNVGVKYYFTTK